jgi:NitT/TauT family transport system substrate-binding protein
VAESLLEAEGFTDIQYIKLDNPTPNMAVASGQADISMDAVWGFMARVDAGEPVTMLAGVHLGCYELFGTDRIRSIKDLRGKTVSVSKIGDPGFLLLSSMAAYIGLEPATDIKWIERPPAESMRLLAENRVDAYMAFPPEPQELRANGVGHVVVNTATDRPWSQYYCCMAAAHRYFAQRYPIACKRALRAILKAADLCARQPETAAKIVVGKGLAARYDYTLEALKDVPYDPWRTYDPETTLRFHALRLHEVGMIKSSPQKIIDRGTDWRFLNELKKELKA